MYALKEALKEQKRKRDRLIYTMEGLIQAIPTEDAANKARLDAQYDAAEQKLEACLEAIERFEAQLQQSPDANWIERQIKNRWDKWQHDIDFRPQIELLQDIFGGQCVTYGGAAIFVVPQYTTMRAESVLFRLRRWLQSNRDAASDSMQIYNYIHYEFTLTVSEGLDGVSFLKKLLEWFHVSPVGTLAEQIQQAMDLLFASLVNTNTCVGFEIKIGGNPTAVLLKQFLHWFETEFWNEIIRRVNQTIPTTPMVHLLAFFLTDVDHSVLPSDLLITDPDIMGALPAEKGVLVKCENWILKDLIRWLTDHSGLHEYLNDYGYGPNTLQEIAQEAHAFGGGVPVLTWLKLGMIKDDKVKELRRKIENG